MSVCCVKRSTFTCPTAVNRLRHVGVRGNAPPQGGASVASSCRPSAHRRAQFEGEVIPGAKYVLVDDVTSLGGTLAGLSNYIQVFGGVVHDVLVLVNAGRDKSLVPQKHFVQLLQERFDDEFTEIFGIQPAALTANEANYLEGFSTVNAIRNRLASAWQEIDRRLRSKGIARPAQGAASGATAAAGLKPSLPGVDESAR